MAKKPNRHLQNWDFQHLEEGEEQDFRGAQRPKTIDQSRNEDSETSLNCESPDSPVDVNSASPVESLWQATLAISGITCAACVNTITEELKKKDWIRDVSINLIAHNATIGFLGEQHKDDIVESIQDIGYDATIDSITHMDASKGSSRLWVREEDDRHSGSRDVL